MPEIRDSRSTRTRSRDRPGGSAPTTGNGSGRRERRVGPRRGATRPSRLGRALDRATGSAAGSRWIAGRAGLLVADAASDAECRCLVAAGGDGTVAALINDRPGRADRRPADGDREPLRPPLPVRPPARPAGRGDRRRGGSRRSTSASPGRRRFSLMAGFGFDADVVTRHHAARIARTGRARPTHRAAYVEPVLRSSFSYRFPELAVRDRRPGGRGDARRDDGLSSSTCRDTPSASRSHPRRGATTAGSTWSSSASPGPFRALHYLWLVLRGSHLRRDDVQHRRVRSATIASPESVPFQLDGDPGGVGRPRRTAGPLGVMSCRARSRSSWLEPAAGTG